MTPTKLNLEVPEHSPTPEDESPGVPGFRTWRGVYLFVFGCFVLWVALLFALTRMFS
jgi:hypothetical protein